MPLADAARRLWRPPWTPVAGLVVLKWALVAWLASRAEHNGWLYYQGGDQSWYYTSAWVLASGHLPAAVVGYAWPLALAPVAALAGADYLAALPTIVLLEVGVLVPLGVVLVYALGARVAGRRFGYLAASVWVIGPLASVPLFVDRYRPRLIDEVLPQSHGLSAMADFPSTVALVGAAVLALRALESRSPADPLLCGVVTGLAVGAKPANVLFAAAPALAFSLARRPAALAYLGAGLVPAALTLLVWKQRGLGTVPLFTLPEARLAAGALVAGLDPYLRLDWGALGRHFDELREYFWSVRLIQWAPLAGLVGVARVAPVKAAFLASWLAAFVLFKGAAPEASVTSGAFWRLLMPALPAFVVLVAAVPLALPRLGPRLASPPPARRVLPVGAAAGALAAAAALPLVLVAALPLVSDARAIQYPRQGLYIPELAGWKPTVRQTPRGLVISWDEPPSSGAKLTYRIFRTYTPDLVKTGANCSGPVGAAAQCFLEMEQVAILPQRSTVRTADRGGWAYRVAAGADSGRQFDADVMFLSPPVFVSVP